MLDLARYLRDAMRMDEEGFLEAHRSPMLVVDKSQLDAHPEDVSFKTAIIKRRDVFGAQGQAVFPITKNRDNPWAERISIGRARNCDVVLRHASVSKLHAHFFLERSEVILADAKSTNGCRVNDKPLRPSERVALSCGDVLRIGMISATLYSPAGLFRLARERCKAERKRASA